MLPSPSSPKLRRSQWSDLERDMMIQIDINDDDDDVLSVNSILEKQVSSGRLFSLDGTNIIAPDATVVLAFRRALKLGVIMGTILAVTAVCAWFGTKWAKANVIVDESCPVQKWEYPSCHNHLTHTPADGNDIPPIYTPEHWREIRQKYQESVEESSLAQGWEHLYKPVIDKDGKVVQKWNTGFTSPVEFKYSPGKGRGVYATEIIPKGQKVWDNRFQGRFQNECDLRVFLSKLSNEEACNAMFWGYANNFHGIGVQAMTDLDGHGYFNHCSYNDKKTWNSVHHFEDELDTIDYTLPNILSFSLPHSVDEATLKRRNRPGAHGLYAARDILPGEEICFDYDDIQQNAMFDYYTFLFTNSLKVHQWLTK